MSQKEIQPFLTRLPGDLYRWIKIRSAKIDKSMNDIVIEQMQEFRKKCKNKLTDNDIMIS
jgi:hypothetical protein